MPPNVFIRNLRDNNKWQDRVTSQRAKATLWLLICLTTMLSSLACPAVAQKRVALVIGNGAYAKVSSLPNPTRDAIAVEAMLKSAGFDLVQRLNDLAAPAMRRALRDFSDQAREADVAVVFYAGHGIEVNGTNYLIPVDAVLERDIDVEDETVPLERVTQVLEQTKRLRLIILDACRDNPFVRSMKRTVSGRSIGRGLAKVDVLTSDTLIAYAARAGSTAADGQGTNSPYTSALVKHLITPGLDVRLAFGRVRDEVLKSTSNRQEPFVYGSLGGTEIPLVPATARLAPEPPVSRPGLSTPSAAAREWQDVKDTTNIAVLESYIQRHKDDPVYAALARDRLEVMARQKQAALEKGDAERKAAEEARKHAAALKREALSKIAGPWKVRREGQANSAPIATANFTIQVTGDGFSVLGDVWTAQGVFDGTNGYYDWVFTDGRRGRTTIRMDASGALHGQVRGAGIDWDYVATRH